jgi:N-acetylmuramoyl-L-alanine amidase
MHKGRIAVIGLTLAIVGAACSNAADTTGSTGLASSTTVSSPSTTESPSTTSPSTTATSTTTTLSPPTLGLVTPTGVPVAVIDENPNGYLVLTPCGFETEIAEGSPLGPTSVVLDPGHGGPTDTGAVGANGLAEKDVNLRVARETMSELAERGIAAILTRTDDYASPLFVRANFADTIQADLMVSIHHNAPTPGPSELPGIEIFTQNETADSSRLGGLLWEHTRAGLGVFDIAWSAAPDAGVMTVLNSRGNDAYGIIRHPETTTALVELGYISNPVEAELFAQPEYVSVAADSIADAIEDYLMTDETGSGFVEGRVFNPSPGVGQDVCTDPDLG